MFRRASSAQRRPGRRVAAVVATITALLLTVNVASLDAAAGDDGGSGRTGEPVPAGYFVGIDGLVHAYANLAVGGKDGTYFLGPDFDTACGDGAAFDAGLKGLAALAKVIKKSGRNVVFTIAPNKSSAERDKVYALPHGPCDALGIKRQSMAMDHLRSKQYVPLRKALSRTRNAYWKTDAHWNTVGATVFALAVAKALSPRLAAGQRYRKTTRTWVGDLQLYLNEAVPETAPAKVPHNGVRTRTAPGSEAFDPTYQTLAPDNSWISTPARKTWTGKSLLIGDSFTYTALEPMRNLFNTGRSLWVALSPVSELVSAIKDSDTVVIEVVQRFVTTSILPTPDFRSAVQASLAQP